MAKHSTDSCGSATLMCAHPMVGDTPWDRHLNHYQKRAIALAGAVDYGFDVGAVADPKPVTATIVSTLGLTTQTEDVLPTLTECLWTLRVLRPLVIGWTIRPLGLHLWPRRDLWPEGADDRRYLLRTFR